MKAPLSILLFLFGLPLSSQATETPKEDAAFRFAVIGCFHYPQCDPEDYEFAVKEIKEQDVDFVLFLGGMVDPGGKGEVRDLWKGLDRLTKKLGVPVYDVPSDGRLASGDLPKARTAAMGKAFLERYGKRHYSFAHKNNLFIGLDLAAPPCGKGCHIISEDQLEFLKTTIADVSKYDNVFAFAHPSPWLRYEPRGWIKVAHPLIRGKVKYVFGARAHRFDVKTVNDVKYVTLGTPPCAARGSSPFHFLVADVDRKTVSMKLVRLRRPIPLKILEKEVKPSAPVQIDLLQSPDRIEMLKPDRVVKTLGIKPGMSIVDIGAGAGFFAVPLAEALKGTGRVFATDVDAKVNEHLKKKIAGRNLTNVVPVHVKPRGLDPFYKKHKFDIIFMCETYQYLWDPQEYFRELRPSLAKGKGRLYILHFKGVSPFSQVEFQDFRRFIRFFDHTRLDFPVFQRLSQEVRDYIKTWQGQDVPPGIREKIVRDFNKMLSDRRLVLDIIKFDHTHRGSPGDEPGVPLEKLVHRRDHELAKWLLALVERPRPVQLDEGEERALTDIEAERLRKLNHVTLRRLFQMGRLLRLQGTTSIYAEKESIVSTIEAAGYTLVKEHDFLTNHHFLEFKRRK
ncbi:methyltransferase domain-containing protein [Elusimicrobiota bacterium]